MLNTRFLFFLRFRRLFFLAFSFFFEGGGGFGKCFFLVPFQLVLVEQLFKGFRWWLIFDFFVSNCRTQSNYSMFHCYCTAFDLKSIEDKPIERQRAKIDKNWHLIEHWQNTINWMKISVHRFVRAHLCTATRHSLYNN